MLALYFSIGQESYAIPARSIVEVVPKVTLRVVPRSPDWFAGVFAYRGTVIPVVDLSRRIIGTSCRSRLSSRIVVVDATSAEAAVRYGILAERVTDVRRLSEASAAPLGLEGPRYVSSTVIEDGKLVQLIDLGHVLLREPALHASGEA